MAYSTRTDLELVMEPEQVAQLSDDLTGVEAVDTIIDRCISDADGVIDSYIGERYTVPLATVHASVRNASTTIAHYLLLLRRGWTVSEKVKAARDDVFSWLKDVAGRDASVPGAITATSAVASFQNDDRVFTKTNMKTFL